MKQRFIALVNALAVFAALLFVWQLIISIFRVPAFMLPSPRAVASAAGRRFPALLGATEITAVESGGGLAASIIVGVLVALIFAQSRWVRQTLPIVRYSASPAPSLP